MKVGILTTVMGNGHWLKAVAIHDAFESLGMNAEIIDESVLTLPARAIISLARKFHHGISKKNPDAFNKMTEKPANAEIGFLEKVLRSLNFNRKLDYDLLISTYPLLDKALGNKTVVRVIPDIYGHSLYFSGDAVYTVFDEDLKQRIVNGDEKYMHSDEVPHSDRVFTTGLYANPVNCSHIEAFDIQNIPLEKKLKVMLQLSGSSANERTYIEMLKKLDYDMVEPYVIAHTNDKFFRQVQEMFQKFTFIVHDEEKSIFRYDGANLLFNKDRAKAIRDTDICRSECHLNVAKPGDVSSGAIPYIFLSPIGAQEIENGNWAESKQIGRWLMPLEKLRQFSQQEIGAFAAQEVNSIARDREILVHMYSNLKNISHRGAFDVAAIGLDMLGHDCSKIAGYCTPNLLK